MKRLSETGASFSLNQAFSGLNVPQVICCPDLGVFIHMFNVLPCEGKTDVNIIQFSGYLDVGGPMLAGRAVLCSLNILYIPAPNVESPAL